MPISGDSGEALAVDVSCSEDSLIVVLDDGRTVSVPLVWFPRLLAAVRRSFTRRRKTHPTGCGTLCND
jgi:hypothetical protein